jgi:hypothetical protein
MLDTVTRYLAGVSNVLDVGFLSKIFTPIVDRYSSQPLTSAGLVISAGGATTAKTGASDFYASVGGTLVKITAATTLPALTGINFSAGNFQVACFFVDGAGTVTALGGTQGATLGAVVFPQFPVKKALVGFLIITYASPFTGGTTPLDTATTVYVSPLGAFDPTVLN